MFIDVDVMGWFDFVINGFVTLMRHTLKIGFEIKTPNILSWMAAAYVL